ncbi:nucleolar protein 12-domain-containing protein [Favolaschia claudopus]|uniref:Nucleolar protein 12-domain-containing protein n=1 Tax=Favolaschia claudopus TaxID=2862362 RepID=A0AAW0A915_9AGAR
MNNHNIASLTRSHVAIAAKKRAKAAQIKEILFDDDARREFLTGFHKRKVAKADAARKKAVEREKQERLEARREQRRELRERAIENAAQVEQAYGATVDDLNEDEEWTGISAAVGKGKGKQMEEEYEDEDMLATVTVVEDFDPDTLIHGPPAVPKSEPKIPSSSVEPTVTPKEKAERSTKKNKPKKIRYETKDARKAQRTKQRARRTEKAELAGGKASRKKGTSKKRGNGGRR